MSKELCFERKKERAILQAHKACPAEEERRRIRRFKESAL
jgi:hypothetical protein